MVVWQAEQVCPVCLAKLETARAGVVPIKVPNISTKAARSRERIDKTFPSFEVVDRALPEGQSGDLDDKRKEYCIGCIAIMCCNIVARHPLISLSGFIAQSPNRTLSLACRRCYMPAIFARLGVAVRAHRGRDLDSSQYKLFVIFARAVPRHGRLEPCFAG